MNSLVAQRQGTPMVMDEIPRTYYPGRGFLTDQEAYPMDMYGNVKVPEIPKDIFNRAPRYGGGMNVPGAPGNLIATNYTQPTFSPGIQQGIDAYNRMQQQLPGASFDPNQLNVQPKIQPGDPGYNPFLLEQDRDRFILNDPRSGVAEMPRYIRGHQYAPRGVIMTVPDIDSRIFNERVKRGYVPMTPPPPRGAGGPQLPGFV